MNQGKSDMVKQEMVRINIDILGISEPKWMRMGKLNSNSHYNKVTLIIIKSLKHSIWVQPQK